jgi:pyruvate/2-oxoglutarate dehydrogenase complex dihydrolipoamide acyltransferase (E2) component
MTLHLADEGISVEIKDPRRVAPPGLNVIVNSVALYCLEKPIRRACGQDVPAPVGDVAGLTGDPTERIADGPGAAPRRRAISPRARRLAEQHAIDWRRIEGAGADGQIAEPDVRVRFAQPAQAEALPPGKPLARPRQIMAEWLSRSQRERVHIYLTISADMTGARRPHAAGFPYDALFLRGLAIALTEFPVLNSSLIQEQLQFHTPVDIGIALAAKFLSRLQGLLEQASQLQTPELRDNSSKFFSG